MTLISPLPEDIGEHAKLLLGLANDVNDVQTTTDGQHGTGFVVPEYLYELYLKALRLQAGEDITDAKEITPAKRGPGRPKKTQDS